MEADVAAEMWAGEEADQAEKRVLENRGWWEERKGRGEGRSVEGRKGRRTRERGGRCGCGCGRTGGGGKKRKKGDG